MHVLAEHKIQTMMKIVIKTLFYSSIIGFLNLMFLQVSFGLYKQYISPNSQYLDLLIYRLHIPFCSAARMAESKSNIATGSTVEVLVPKRKVSSVVHLHISIQVKKAQKLLYFFRKLKDKIPESISCFF